MRLRIFLYNLFHLRDYEDLIEAYENKKNGIIYAAFEEGKMKVYATSKYSTLIEESTSIPLQTIDEFTIFDGKN